LSTERPYPTAPAAGRQRLCLSFWASLTPFVFNSPCLTRTKDCISQ
jgi:hypothetical protein